MRRIDEIHLPYPFYGSRKIRNKLWAQGYDISRDKVRRLMRRIGIEALFTSLRHGANCFILAVPWFKLVGENLISRFIIMKFFNH